MLKTKPKPGTKVRCVDNSSCRFLTKDKVYEVIEPTTQATKYGVGLFDYLDDDGDVLYYSGRCIGAERFELVEELTVSDSCSTKDLTFKKKEESMQSVSKEPTPDAFQVGDVVWDLFFGRGEVSEIDQGAVEVSFSNTAELFSLDGVHFGIQEQNVCNRNARTLFFSEPKIEGSVTRPFVPSLVGKTVMVQFYDGSWSDPLAVAKETQNLVHYGNGGYHNKDDIAAIREVSSENLLKK